MQHHWKHCGLRKCLLTVFLVLIGLSCKSEQKESQQTVEPDRPNILFIAVDDLRPELNFYGAKHIQSPNLDALASESLIFDRAYCNIPTCGASRASILTGTRPTRFRYLTHDVRVDEQAPKAVTLPELFKQNGYTTISNGKVFHHEDDRVQAWDKIWRPDGSSRDYQDKENIELDSRKGLRGRPFEATDTDELDYFDGKIATKGIEDLQKLKKGSKPFFLALGFMKPHLPFNAPQKYWDKYPLEDIVLPESYVQPQSIPSKAFHGFGELRRYHGVPEKGPVSDAMAKKLIQGYYSCVSYVDSQIGRVLDELDNLELSENTVIVLWGDHGWNLGEHKLWCKHCTFETSLHSPLVLKVPGKTNGRHTEAITEFIDIYPSLAELAGLDVPKNQLEGESFVPLLEDKKRQKDYAVSKFGDAVTLIEGNLFYTEWTDDSGEPYERMLFDHSTDPMELNNLAEKEDYGAKVDSLSKQLRQRWGKDFLTKTFSEKKTP